MMAVRPEVDGYPLLSFPGVYVAEPKPGSVFRYWQHQLLEKYCIPTEKNAILHCISCNGKFVLSFGVFNRLS